MKNYKYSFKNNSWIVLCFFLGLIIISAPAFAFLGKIKSFTADQIITNREGAIIGNSKLYVTPEKIRYEMTASEQQPGMVMIFRKDLKVNWMLRPDNRMYLENPLDEKEMEKTLKTFALSKSETSLGNETINGFKCEKKQVEVEVTVMGFTTKSKSTVWISDKIDYPIRTQSENGSIAELRNIKDGEPDDSYFNIPNGYKQAANMLELMGVQNGSENSENDDADNGNDGSPFDLLKNVKLPWGNNK